MLFDALDAGSYDVEIDVPVDFEIAPADTNRKAVTVTVGNTTDVQFAIVSTLVATDTVDVSASGASFTPGSVTIDAGSTVRWTKGTNPHTVTPDGHTEWSEATLDSTGETFLHTFTTPGTFPYHCEVHAGMTGTITVQ